MKQGLIWTIVLFFVLLSSQSYALDYTYSPMNFDEQTNHTFEVNLPGSINVTLPTGFTLVSGSLTGTNNVTFIAQSPIVNSSDSELFVGTIYLNGSEYEDYYLLYVQDEKIVDNKLQVGHGDGNYIDGDSYIGTDRTLLFSLVRVWPIGSDILDEPATNVRFNCTYPLIIPNTVDSKYTTDYSSTEIQAEGLLTRMEGLSLFRLFVLSQEVEQAVGSNYEVTCDKLYYDYTHTSVQADIPDFNVTIRSLEPLVINTQDNPGYVTYTIMNNELYDLRELEFLYTIGTNTLRGELDSLDAGETVQYDIPTNSSGSISFKARFKPEWMFNSRAPTYYEQTEFDTYDTPSFLEGLNTSLYYNNQSVLTTPILETQIMDFSITTLQSPPFGGNYKVTHLFYDEDSVLVSTMENEITGVDDFIISFADASIEPSGTEEDYNVYSIVSIRDDNGDWYDFPMELIGVQTIAALTDNGASANVNLTGTTGDTPTVSTPTIITGNVVSRFGLNGDYMWWYIWLLIIVLFLLFFIISVKVRRKRRYKVKAPNSYRNQYVDD